MADSDLTPITVGLRADQVAALRELAEYSGLSSAVIVRRAVDMFVTSQRKANPDSPHARARALVEQHGFEPDVAFLSAWYATSAAPPPTLNQALARMQRVQHVPLVSADKAKALLAAYSRRKRG